MLVIDRLFKPVSQEAYSIAMLIRENFPDLCSGKVQIIGTDISDEVLARAKAGAFTLAENYLYTVEAMKTWYARLAPGGRLTFTRWWYEPPRQTLVDLPYPDTATAAAARAAGAEVIGGLEVLVAQGAASFELWTGVPAPVATMRAAVGLPP